MTSLNIFQNKVMEEFLKLSNSSPVPSPAELFTSEPSLSFTTSGVIPTPVYKMVEYILTMCESSSTTWSNHLQLLCLKYGLPSPLLLMQSGPSWSKEDWHCLVKTRVTIWFENYLRGLSIGNSKMKYLNV